MKEGLRNGAEASIRFGFAHRLRREPVCRRGRPRLLANSVRRRGRFGALSGVWPDSVSPDSKSPRRIFRRGLNSCDDENMPVICPTCQNVFAGSLKRPDHATLHGVVLDIFVERPIHGSKPCRVGAIAVRQFVRRNSAVYCAAVRRWVDDALHIRPN